MPWSTPLRCVSVEGCPKGPGTGASLLFTGSGSGRLLFLFQRVKKELAGVILTQQRFKKTQEGVLRSFDEFALPSGSGCVGANTSSYDPKLDSQKSLKRNTLLTMKVVFLFMLLNLILNVLHTVHTIQFKYCTRGYLQLQAIREHENRSLDAWADRSDWKHKPTEAASTHR